MQWIKASERLPIVGIYNALYNGDHCIFQVHDGGFRIINYHGEKDDSPQLHLIKWLDEQPSPDWVSVEDRLPEHSGKYLTASTDYHKVGHAWYNNKYRPGWEDDKEETIMVTHWMPLPEPPKTDNP